jgi:hypothetical protein
MCHKGSASRIPRSYFIKYRLFFGHDPDAVPLLGRFVDHVAAFGGIGPGTRFLNEMKPQTNMMYSIQSVGV